MTTDHLTSLAIENYGAIKIYFIEEFEPKAFILSCTKHESGASAEEIVNQLICDTDISITWIFTSNMNGFGRTIEGWHAKHLRRHTIYLTVSFS